MSKIFSFTRFFL